MITNHLDAYAIVACSDPPAMNATNAIRLCASDRSDRRAGCLAFSCFLCLLSRAALNHDVAATPIRVSFRTMLPPYPISGSLRASRLPTGSSRSDSRPRRGTSSAGTRSHARKQVFMRYACCAENGGSLSQSLFAELHQRQNGYAIDGSAAPKWLC